MGPVPKRTFSSVGPRRPVSDQVYHIGDVVCGRLPDLAFGAGCLSPRAPSTPPRLRASRPRRVLAAGRPAILWRGAASCRPRLTRGARWRLRRVRRPPLRPPSGRCRLTSQGSVRRHGARRGDSTRGHAKALVAMTLLRRGGPLAIIGNHEISGRAAELSHVQAALILAAPASARARIVTRRRPASALTARSIASRQPRACDPRLRAAPGDRTRLTARGGSPTMVRCSRV